MSSVFLVKPSSSSSLSRHYSFSVRSFSKFSFSSTSPRLTAVANLKEFIVKRSSRAASYYPPELFVRMNSSTSSSSSSLSTTPATPTSGSTFDIPANSSNWILVYGGNGAMGQAMVKTFKEAKWKTISVDFFENKEADIGVLLDPKRSWKQNTEMVVDRLNDLKKEKEDDQGPPPFGLSALVCVAGGWKGGNISSAALFDSVDSLIPFNIHSSLAAAHISSLFSLPHSLLLLTGAKSALSPLPSQIAYGITKAATHHLTLSLSSEESELTKRGVSVVCVLPVTIDTPSNRSVMKGWEKGGWTPTEEFSKHALYWAKEAEKKQQTKNLKESESKKSDSESSMPGLIHGGFYLFETNNFKTTVTPTFLGATHR